MMFGYHRLVVLSHCDATEVKVSLTAPPSCSYGRLLLFTSEIISDKVSNSFITSRPEMIRISALFPPWGAKNPGRNSHEGIAEPTDDVRQQCRHTGLVLKL